MTKAISSEIEKRLAGLSIGTKAQEPPNDLFVSQLKLTGFKLFEPLADLGYFTWLPYGPYTRLSSVESAEKIKDKIEYEGKPRKMAKKERLLNQLPIPFESPEPQEIANRFPYGRYEIAGLHVASQHRGLRLDEVNFAFGGSTLEMLAKRDTQNPYYIMRVPHSNLKIIVNGREYTKDYSHFGHQFERFVVGRRMRDKDDLAFSEHLQLMKVGPYRVLFQAEVDALYKDAPIEVKAAHPKYWGTKVMFRMISSGSPYLCQGVKFKGKLSQINVKPLKEVAKAAFVGEDINVLEQNILENMADLQMLMSNALDDVAYSISFVDRKIRLTEMKSRNAVIFPDAEIVKELTSVFDASELVW